MCMDELDSGFFALSLYLVTDHKMMQPWVLHVVTYCYSHQSQ